MSLPILVPTRDLSEFHEVLTNEGIRIEKNDCITIRPSGQNIRIDQIRSLRRYLANSGKSPRQIIFYSFHKASIESQNALLKLLEEAGSKFRFALQVDSIEQVLSTIRSRCRILVVPKTVAGVSEPRFDLSDFTDSNLFDKKMTVTKKDEAEEIFLSLLSLLRSRLQNGEMWTIQATKKTLSLLHLLKQNNLNPQLAVDQCVLHISLVK